MNQLADAAYFSRWYNLNTKERKLFLILLMQLQMEAKNNSYELVELNYRACAEVIFIILIV